MHGRWVNALMQDWYSHVPKTLKKNVEWRLEFRRALARDAALRRACMEACSEDVLFWLNAFVMLHEPRTLYIDGFKQPQVIPFITRPHQDKAIVEIKSVLGRSDVGVEKARGEGMSWIGVLLALHDWIFGYDVTVGVCSSSEDKCDKPGDRGTLLGKFEWELSVLPNWMIGRKAQRNASTGDWVRNTSEHTFFHRKKNNLVVGTAATSRSGRGHRFTWFLLDEMAEWNAHEAEGVLASLQHATESRLFVSTPLGSSGPYYEIMHRPTNMKRVVLDWKDNPTRNKGLYRWDHGVALARDPDNDPLPREYHKPSPDIRALWTRLEKNGFHLQDTVRSPWYDRECDRAGATPQKIAQELDRDYGGSTAKIFGAEFFTKAEGAVRGPFVQGELSVNPETLESSWQTVNDGSVKLWCKLDVQDRPPHSLYVAGADICTGLAGSFTSNSVLTIINAMTMEQVFEFAINSLNPTNFADFCIAACRWFWNAYLVWERGGPGHAFTQQIYERQYDNCYIRQRAWRHGKRKRPTDHLGFAMTKESKERVFAQLLHTISTGQLQVRSDTFVKECSQFVRERGLITHKLSAGNDSDSEAGEAHGDRVIAMAMAVEGLKDRPVIHQEKAPQEVPPGSLAERMQNHESELRRASDDWDDRANWQLAGHGALETPTGALL